MSSQQKQQQLNKLTHKTITISVLVTLIFCTVPTKRHGVVEAKGLVGKLPGNPASCQEEPCNSDPQHVLAALKVMCMFLAAVLILPLLLYYLSKMFTKIRGVCCPHEEGAENKHNDGEHERNEKKANQELEFEAGAPEKQPSGRQASNNLCSISVISSKDGHFQVAASNSNNINKPSANYLEQKNSPETNQINGGGDGEQQMQKMAAASRHQSLQYAASAAQGMSAGMTTGTTTATTTTSMTTGGAGAHRLSRSPRSFRVVPGGRQTGHQPQQAQPQQQEGRMRRQTQRNGANDDDDSGDNKLEEMMGDEENEAMIEEMSRKYNLQPHQHRYSMFFGGGVAGVGVATPALHPHQATLEQIDQLRQSAARASFRNSKLSPSTRRRRGTTAGAGQQQTFGTNNNNNNNQQAQAAHNNPLRTMSNSIKRKKSSGQAGYKIHPATNCEDLDLENNSQQPQELSLANNCDAIDSYSSSNNHNNNNNPGHHHHRPRQHERLRGGQSAPYAGGRQTEESASRKTNKRLMAGSAGGPNGENLAQAQNLELPVSRPEHRHSIDGSILNNMALLNQESQPRQLDQQLLGAHKMAAAVTPMRHQQQARKTGNHMEQPIRRPSSSPSPQQKCLEQLESAHFDLQQRQQQQQQPILLGGGDGNQTEPPHHYHHQHHGHSNRDQDNRLQWQPPATSGQQLYLPAGSTDGRHRRASLNAAALKRPGGRNGFD